MNTLTILVIDDEIEFHEQVRQALPDAALLTACSGLEGIDLLRRHTYVSLVVLDIGMHFGGERTASILRTEFPDIPILVYSYRDSKEAEMRALGAFFLQKRVSPERLGTVIGTILRGEPWEPQTSPLLGSLYQVSRELEQLYRRTDTRLRTAIMAPSRRIGMMLEQAFTDVGCAVEVFLPTTHQSQSERIMQTHARIDLLVHDATVLRYAQEFANRYHVPLVSIGMNKTAAYTALAYEAKVVVANLDDETVLRDAVAAALESIPYRDPILALALARLPESKHQVVWGLLANMPVADIAQRCGFQNETIHKYKQEILQKFGVDSLAELRSLIDAE